MKQNFYFLLILSSLFIFQNKGFTQTSGNQENLFPKIDGKINASEWNNAKVFTDFFMIVPKSEKKDMDSTVVYVKQSKDALYFAFKFYPKSKVISQSLIRDRSTDEESEFFILLDLENKRQNGYMFAFSFIDNQRDILIYNQRNQSYEWDWVWENKSTIYREATENEPGYIESEIKIPVDKIQNKNLKQIGINFQMFAYRPDGTGYFYSIVPNSELMSIKDMYSLNIEPFDEKLNLNITATPFVVGEGFNDSTYKTKFGGEMNVSLDKHKLKATLNTDESTLEADPFSFSFYNRPIYLTEKRPFFSKDLDIYRSQINLFYTRAIENINYGFNYTYRSDNMKTGLIYLKEKNDDITTGRDYFVFRPKFEFDNFNLGGFFLSSNNNKFDFHERILSLDGRYRFPKNKLRLLGQYATNFDGSAYNIYAYYENNDDGGPFADLFYNKVDKNFSASTMFNGRVSEVNDYDEINASGGYAWKFDRTAFSTININGGYYRSKILSTGFNMQDRLSVNFFTKITGFLSFSTYYEYNRPDDYDVNGNLTTRKNFLQEYYLQYIFGNNSVYAGYFFGTYFGSNITNPYLGINFNVFNRLSLNTSVNFINVFNTDRTIINARMDFKIMKKLFFRAFYRKDTYSQASLLNAMLQYEFFAGSNIYFVLNLDGNDLQYTRRYFKIGYDFNF